MSKKEVREASEVAAVNAEDLGMGEWREFLLGDMTRKIGSGATPRGGKEAYKGGGTALIRSQNIHNLKFSRDGLAYIDDTQAADLRNVIVEESDVLLNITGDSVARCSLVDPKVLPARVNQHVAIIRPLPTVLSAQFLQYVLVSPLMQEHLLALASAGATRNALTKSMLESLVLRIPPLPEQRAIAAFLDHEVAKIDELIAEQERLIELLAEKRQATISHAVTKGLDPNAKLKPSGVEWLGDVPEDWEVVPLKYLVRFDSGSTPSKERLDYWDGAIPWASAKDLKSEYLSDTGLHISNNAVQDGVVKIYPAGVVIVLVRGMTLAKTFPVCLTRIPIAINQDLKVLTPIAKISGEYLALALRGLSKESLSRVEEAGHGTKALRMSEWTSMHVPVPPEREQPKLVSQIELFLSRVDSLTTAAREAIALLQERRSSLISAAVTGKIDVRDFVAAEEESA